MPAIAHLMRLLRRCSRPPIRQGAVAMLAVMLAGCNLLKEDAPASDARSLNRQPDPTVRPDGPAETTVGHPPPAPKYVVLQVSFDVLRVRAPEGAFSQSGKLWNHLDEEAIPSATGKLMQRNGLRVGRGRTDVWPAIRALLESDSRIMSSSNRMVVGNGLPLMVEFDPVRRDRTLFMFRPDGRLAGASFPRCQIFLRIEYAIPATEPNDVILDIMPEVRMEETRVRSGDSWEDLLNPRLEQPSRVFRELSFRVQVSPEEFVTVGPSPASAQRHLLGSACLCEESDGQWFESVYFITPRVLAKSVSAGP